MLEAKFKHRLQLKARLLVLAELYLLLLSFGHSLYIVSCPTLPWYLFGTSKC